MKLLRTTLVLAALSVPLVCLAAPKKHAPKKAPAHKTAATSFACKHCGLKITVKSKADLNKKCAVCRCGKTNKQCQPTAKK